MRIIALTLSAMILASCSSVKSSHRPPASVEETNNGVSLPLPNEELRGRIFSKLVEEMERLDGEGLLPRKNRPEAWKKTVDKLKQYAVEAKNWVEFGHAFKMLNATYPNLHARQVLNSRLDLSAKKNSRLEIGARFGAEQITPGQSQFTYRVGIVKKSLFADLPEKERPRKGDILLAINGRPMQEWSRENFIFCKFPLREQCEDEIFENFRREQLSWYRFQPLYFTIQRDKKKWMVDIPVRAQSFVEPERIVCGDAKEKQRYPGFTLAYQGTNACAYESPAYPDTQILRIKSFNYHDTPRGAPVDGIHDEVERFWEKYWKQKSAGSKKLIIDVIDNRGGDTPIEWYGLFFPGPYQEQYVSFKKIAEYVLQPDLFKQLTYEEKGKHLWFEKIKADETWEKTQFGDFLPQIPQFCAKKDQECTEGMFEPKANAFNGQLRILMDQGCVSACAGFVWNFKNVLQDRVRLYGFPDSGDSNYARIYLDLFLDPSSPDGFRMSTSKKSYQDRFKLPEGALLRQGVSITRTTDSKGNVISGIPQKPDVWVPKRFHYTGETWEESVVKKALE